MLARTVGEGELALVGPARPEAPHDARRGGGAAGPGVGIEREDLHSVISAVSNADLAGIVQRQALWVGQLSWFRSFHGFACSIDGADNLEDCVIFVEDLNTVIASIYYNDAPVPVHSDISRAVELTRIFTLNTDRLRDCPVLIKNMHLVLLEIGHQNSTLQVHRDAARALQMGCADDRALWEGDVRLDGSEMALDAPARNAHSVADSFFLR